MKTLADFKREITGTKWILTERSGKPMNEVKEVCHIQTNAIAFKKGDGKSWLPLPPASLMEYTGDSFTIYSPGERELTEKERKILGNQPSHMPGNREIVERDALSDGNQSYYMDKRYFKENDADWYWDWYKGKRYSHNTDRMKDRAIKGAVELKYVKVQPS